MITNSLFSKPEEAVAYMGAIQAQDFSGALWSIGQRISNGTIETVERAIAERKIVRSWPMRGTLHIVASEDLRWMLQLLAPRIIRGSLSLHRQLELDEAVFSKSLKVLEKAFRNSQQLRRDEVYKLFESAGISCSGQRGIHIIGHLARLGYICHGSHIGKQATYVWLDSWIPPTKSLSREEALAKLAMSYFRSHGPATLRDFVWWTGVKITEAEEAIALVHEQLVEIAIGDNRFLITSDAITFSLPKRSVDLLSGFDEFILGYADRTFVVNPSYLPKLTPGKNGVFMPTVVMNGYVKGIWKRTIHTKTVEIEFHPFADEGLTRELEKKMNEYAAFLGKELVRKS